MTDDELSHNDHEFRSAVADLGGIFARQHEVATDLGVIAGTFDRETGRRLVAQCEQAAEELRAWLARPAVLDRSYDTGATGSPFVEFEQGGIAALSGVVAVFEAAAEAIRSAKPVGRDST